MRPETWYQLFWLAMGLAFMALNFVVVRYAVRDGIVMAARILGWTKE